MELKYKSYKNRKRMLLDENQMCRPGLCAALAYNTSALTVRLVCNIT